LKAYSFDFVPFAKQPVMVEGLAVLLLSRANIGCERPAISIAQVKAPDIFASMKYLLLIGIPAQVKGDG
jgi:hypothetical protein